MQPIIRIDGYVQEYIDLIHKTYNKSQNVYFVDYYRIDKENSTYDDHYKSPYELVGNLSGMKWTKIYNVPIFQADTVSTELSFSESGLNKKDSGTTSFIFSPEVPLIPRAGDIMISHINNDLSIFLITSTSYDLNLDYKTSYTKVNGTFLDDPLEILDKQISKRYVYIEPIHQIIEYQYAIWLLQLYDNLNTVLQELYRYLNRVYNAFTINTKNQVSYIIDFNYIFINLLKNKIPDFIMIHHQFDHDYNDFSMNNKSILHALFFENVHDFNEISFGVRKINPVLNLYINPIRYHFNPNLSYYDTNGNEIDLLDFLEYSSSEKNNIIYAINQLQNYKTNNPYNFESIATTPQLCSVIKYHYIIQDRPNQITHFLPELIKHLSNAQNMLELLYSIYIITNYIDLVRSKNREFN